MITVDKVEKNSLADIAGILSGDKILRMNDEEVRDRLDFEFYKSEEWLDIEVMRGDQILQFAVERRDGAYLGIEPEIMKIHLCKNNCVFCFVHQTPKGMRRSLYVKDEDYRYSFLDGHFTTLSNMKESDWERVLAQRLSPIYISVHATNPVLRAHLLKNQKIEPILPRLAWMQENNIQFHTQLVLIPGMNDGDELERSIRELLDFHPHMLSISIVPVGLTSHRKGLPDLRCLNQAEALDAIHIANKWMDVSLKRYGLNLIFPSDEMYVLAGVELPESKFYGDFSQYQNGVGTLRALMDDFEKELPALPLAKEDWTVTVLTGGLARDTLSTIMQQLEKKCLLRYELIDCENLTFGKTVTCTGLLCGKDFLAALEKSELQGQILIPPNSLNSEGLFLDDISIPELSERCNRPILAPKSFLDYFPKS